MTISSSHTGRRTALTSPQSMSVARNSSPPTLPSWSISIFSINCRICSTTGSSSGDCDDMQSSSPWSSALRTSGPHAAKPSEQDSCQTPCNDTTPSRRLMVPFRIITMNRRADE
eukprot:GHUV01040529.1.p2 GENE.GHUV01040529.1~~GHUV01040529.1.p2  ORF type:complete len:114 (+),score=15.40 GHUV01040529.1:354-695(+)